MMNRLVVHKSEKVLEFYFLELLLFSKESANFLISGCLNPVESVDLFSYDKVNFLFLFIIQVLLFLFLILILQEIILMFDIILITFFNPFFYFFNFPQIIQSQCVKLYSNLQKYYRKYFGQSLR